MEEQIIIGVAVAVVYSILGYIESGERFSVKKFVKTFVISLAVAAGFEIALPTDIYLAPLGVPMITVLVQKIYGAAKGMAMRLKK